MLAKHNLLSTKGVGRTAKIRIPSPYIRHYSNLEKKKTAVCGNVSMIFLLPVFNEEACIQSLLEKISEVAENHKIYYQVFVIDDGSTDASIERIRPLCSKMPIRIFSHSKNMGLGAAVKSGLLAACQEQDNDTMLVIMDADNTHDPSTVVKMLNKIREGNDIVIASRYKNGGGEIGVPLARRFYSKAVCLLLKVLFPISGVQDYSNGFRMYRLNLLKKALSQSENGLVVEKGFTCMVELLLRLRNIGAKISEVPNVLRYDLKKGPSKMNVPRTVIEYLSLVFRNLFSSEGGLNGGSICVGDYPRLQCPEDIRGMPAIHPKV